MVSRIAKLMGKLQLVDDSDQPAVLQDRTQVVLFGLPKLVAKRLGVHSENAVSAVFSERALPADEQADRPDAFYVRNVPFSLAELVGAEVAFL